MDKTYIRPSSSRRCKGAHDDAQLLPKLPHKRNSRRVTFEDVLTADGEGRDRRRWRNPKREYLVQGEAGPERVLPRVLVVRRRAGDEELGVARVSPRPLVGGHVIVQVFFVKLFLQYKQIILELPHLVV